MEPTRSTMKTYSLEGFFVSRSLGGWSMRRKKFSSAPCKEKPGFNRPRKTVFQNEVPFGPVLLRGIQVMGGRRTSYFTATLWESK